MSDTQHGGYGPPQQNPGPQPQQFYGPPPRGNRTGLVLAVGGAVLAVVVAVVLVVVLTGRDGEGTTSAVERPSDPETLVDEIASRIEGGDLDAVGAYACGSSSADSIGNKLAKFEGLDVTVNVIKVTDTDNFAVAAIQVRSSGDSDFFALRMRPADGGWCALKI